MKIPQGREDKFALPAISAETLMEWDWEGACSELSMVLRLSLWSSLQWTEGVDVHDPLNVRNESEVRDKGLVQVHFGQKKRKLGLRSLPNTLGHLLLQSLLGDTLCVAEIVSTLESLQVKAGSLVVAQGSEPCFSCSIKVGNSAAYAVIETKTLASSLWMAGPPGNTRSSTQTGFQRNYPPPGSRCHWDSRRLSHTSPFLLLLKSHGHSLLGRFPPDSSRQIPAWLGVKVLAAGSASTANWDILPPYCCVVFFIVGL